MVTQKEIIAALLGDETDGPMSRYAIYNAMLAATPKSEVKP